MNKVVSHTVSYAGQCFLLALFMLMIAWLSLFSWSIIPISPTDALQALYHLEPDSIAQHIVRDLRLPRVLVALLVGACLAAAGVIMQGLTLNPLASPSVLGVNAGAAFGMALVSTITPWFGLFGTTVAAMIGGGIAWSLVMLLGNAWRTGNDAGRLVLAGVAISALCAALTKALVIIEEDQAAAVLTWLAGSLTDARWQTFDTLWPIACCALFGAMAISPSLNLLQLGDDNARNLGVSLAIVKLSGSFLVLLLVGASLSAVGTISFVGLLVPHMAKLLCGQDHRRFLPVAMLLGACLVAAADVFSRIIIFPMETPAGAILALIGAPFFIYLVRKKTL